MLHVPPLCERGDIITVRPPIVQAVKHETLTQCWANVGRPFGTLAQHQTTTGSTLRVRWVSVCAVVTLSRIYFSPALSMVRAVKHETLTQCWSNFDPPSSTLSQHQPSIGLAFP